MVLLKYVIPIMILSFFYVTMILLPAYASTAYVSISQDSSVPGCEEDNSCYLPYQTNISKGDTVIWTNDDSTTHTVTSGNGESGPDELFDSSLIMSGDTFTLTFEESGTFDYFCMIHPWMQAQVLASTSTSATHPGLSPRGTPLPIGQTPQSFTDTYYNDEFGFTFKIPDGWYVFDEPMHDGDWKRIVTFTPDPDYLSTYLQLNYVNNNHDYDGLTQFQIEDMLSNVVQDWCSALTYAEDGVICYDLQKGESYSRGEIYGITSSYTLQYSDGEIFEKSSFYGIDPLTDGEYFEIDAEVSANDVDYVDDLIFLLANSSTPTYTGSPQSGTIDISEISYSIHNNNEYGFSISYPDGWYVDDKPIIDGNYVNIVAFYPDASTTDLQYFEVAIQRNDLEYRGISSAQYIDNLKKIENDFCRNSSYDKEGYTCSNFLVSDELTGSFIDASGNTWHALYYSYTENYSDNSYDVAVARFELPVKDDTWIIYFYFDQNTYADYFGNTDPTKIVSDIASSFNIVSPTVSPTTTTIPQTSIITKPIQTGFYDGFEVKYGLVESQVTASDHFLRLSLEQLIQLISEDLVQYDGYKISVKEVKDDSVMIAMTPPDCPECKDDFYEFSDWGQEIFGSGIPMAVSIDSKIGDKLQSYYSPKDAVLTDIKKITIAGDKVDVFEFTKKDIQNMQLETLGDVIVEAKSTSLYDTSTGILLSATVDFVVADPQREGSGTIGIQATSLVTKSDIILLKINEANKQIQNKNYGEAKRIVLEALQIDPNNVKAQNKLDEIKALENSITKGGGCLIATATFGSELAPQVQQLRELRDNQLLQTESGKSFLNSFNAFYYSFSPAIADYERENPLFKETVKITLTPMISSLSILNYVDMDSEDSVIGYGISLILLNLGMYFVAPAIVIHTIRKKF